MQQQPILTYDEMIELLKEALWHDETWREAFMELVVESEYRPWGRRYTGDRLSIQEISALLQHCAKILQSRGIFAYVEVYDASAPRSYLLIAGECGLLYEKLEKQKEHLRDLSQFIQDHKDKLPSEMVAKKYEIDNYAAKIEINFLFELRDLYPRTLYEGGVYGALKSWCEEARKFAEEVDAFLESIEDLRRLHALAMQL
jgi:hypothetical protein